MFSYYFFPSASEYNKAILYKEKNAFWTYFSFIVGNFTEGSRGKLVPAASCTQRRQRVHTERALPAVTLLKVDAVSVNGSITPHHIG